MFELTAEARAEEALPVDEAEIFAVGNALVDAVETTWKKGKLYNFSDPHGPELHVQTFHTYRGSEYWLCRQSRHQIDEPLYEKMVYYLNGSERGNGGWTMPERARRSRLEKEYIEVLSACDVIKTTPSGWVLVNLEYDLGRPLAIRDFNQWVYAIPPRTSAQGAEVCMVVSLNAKVPMKQASLHKKHTPAYYVSVERLTYDRGLRQLEWTMCTSSDAGGNVPKWVQNATIAKTVARDVPYLFEFLHRT